ncbi:Chaperone J-domain superfamily [Sesbania bispinosa]|nr:Chaperone J-domain superfamily [Sesbania bispinosa]
MEENQREREDNKVEVINVTQTDSNYGEIKGKEADNSAETSSCYEPDETEKLSKAQAADTIIENDETPDVTPEGYSCDVQDDTVVASNASSQHRGALELDETVNQMQNTFETVTFKSAATNIGETDMKVRQNQDQCLEEAEDDCNRPMLVEETTPESEELCKDAKEARVATNIGETDMKARQNQDQCLEKAENDCNAAMLVEETTPESGEICKDVKEARVASDEEIDENQSNSSNEESLFDNEHNIEASQIPSMSEWKSSSFKEEEVKSIHSNLKESHQASMTTEEKEADARERAFAGARERAALERAAAEARQKNISDGRERLGKSTSQANEKTPAEKAAMEAKLKAERAAVERATAEARARALERALSEKAASEARNKSDKSVVEKNLGMKQNLHSKSFSYGEVRDSTDVFDGAGGDSAQRCKARSERHQRIGERVAKALAEKNMRDWLVQKEQEDRNRVAEALDADVKRWSSGKAGNLRALLSTLQYILGPDSGWQPIPLTDIVTTTAVKKAYRKATLFVHPDKLQQRGASIQQKKLGTDSTWKNGEQYLVSCCLMAMRMAVTIL